MAFPPSPFQLAVLACAFLPSFMAMREGAGIAKHDLKMGASFKNGRKVGMRM